HLFRSNNLRTQIRKTANGVTRFNVSKKLMEKVVIPVPPLPVQREIVRILDNFTNLTAELTAELTARKKQYEYYRNKLLSQNESTPKLVLKTVVKKSTSGGTPKKGNSEYYENGTVPWLRTQDVRFNEIYEINSFITEEAVKKTSAKWIPENCVIVAISGATAGRCAINKIATTTNQHCLNMEIDSSKALYKYVYYCLFNQYEEMLSRKQGARGDLNSSLILGIEIPLPDIDKQKQIVDILDRFDTLCNDISTGLPAEIEARRKQYEYYRDKLLTFKELA
ncbi:MAG: restriction endonuclease subunit S, partial [Eubacteriaceae bacterium]